MKKKQKHEIKLVHSSGAYHPKSFNFSKHTMPPGNTEEWLSSLSDRELEELDAEFAHEDPEMHAWFKSLSDEELERIAKGMP